jgi:uncharacterized protein YjbI with pentapeptide repeats
VKHLVTADLSDADLSRAILMGFIGTNLSGANLSGAPLDPKAPAGLSIAGCPVVASTDTLPAWDRTAELRSASVPLRKLRLRPSVLRLSAGPSPRRRK